MGTEVAVSHMTEITKRNEGGLNMKVIFIRRC